MATARIQAEAREQVLQMPSLEMLSSDAQELELLERSVRILYEERRELRILRRGAGQDGRCACKESSSRLREWIWTRRHFSAAWPALRT